MTLNDGTASKVVRKKVNIDGGTHQDELQVAVLHQTVSQYHQQEVTESVSLMDLILYAHSNIT